MKKEVERIEHLIQNRDQMNDDEMSPDMTNEILVVSKLVKRYYTAPPVDDDNHKEHRPTLTDQEDDQKDAAE